VLAAQFGSFRDPFIVLLGSVPLALTGALVFTASDFTTINIYSQVGLITLVGLVAKNGILIVEFANHLQEQGCPSSTPSEAAVTRLRPDPHDLRGDGVRPLPARARHRRRCRGPQQHLIARDHSKKLVKAVGEAAGGQRACPEPAIVSG
jgi:hypothetical protein